MSPTKKQRVECALIAHHQNKMAALRAELARAVGMAVYRKHWPFDVCDPDEDFLSDEHGRVNKGALVLYRYHEFESDCLPPPPAGTYGTPDEMEAQHTEDREERRWAAEERAFYEK